MRRRGLATLAVLAAPFFSHAQPGIITTVAGITGSSGFAGDGGAATSARISPDGVAVDGLGNVYTAESGNDRIRKINTAGIITTIAGNGTGGYSGDGGPGVSAALSNPMRVGVDAAGNAYFPVLGGHIRKVTTAGAISTVAGGALGFSGDGGPAIRAGISQAPFGVAVDSPGNNFYFADSAYQRIRRVNADGIISTIAGTGTAGFSGDGGQGTSAQINGAVGVAVDKTGNVYIADTGNARIRKVDTSGRITTVAGNGTTGYSGDGGQATSATLNAPAGVATDDAGNLYIADSGNFAVRKVDTSGKITTVAGTGKKGASVDGGAATASTLNAAADVASDGAGNLYIVDGSRIRKVNAGSAAGGGGGAAGPTPVVTSIVDAAAYTPTIAQGSVFVVKGTNLCSSGTVFGSLPYSQAPLNGVQITFSPVGGGSSAGAYMVYTYAAGSVNQLAAILPSSVPTGDYNVTVTNNGAASAAFKTTVVAHKFGIITAASSGAGRAVVQNYISPTQYDLGRYTTGTLSGYTYSPSHPGQIIVIWGTGIGPITSPDNIVPGAIDLRASLNVQVLIDGVAFKPDLYAGRAPTLPGADEIILTLPANVSTGCLLTLQVSVNGQLSNLTNIAVAPGSDTACTAPGITTAQLARLDQGGDFKVGTLALAGGTDTSGNTSIRVDTAGAIFVSVNTGELTAVAPAPTTPVPNNSCVVTRQILTVTIPTTVLPAFSLLAPGTLTLSGPNISNATISTETLLNARLNGVTVVNGGVLAAGTYTVTGAGGKDVGPFKASITMSQPLVVTSTVPGTIPRSQDLTLSWNGGGTDPVIITGSSSVAAPGSTAANPIVDSGSFTCMTTGDKRTFTIPASILGQLPAARGSITVTSNSQNINFTAPLTAGGNLDAGYFSTGFSSRFGSLTFQ